MFRDFCNRNSCVCEDKLLYLYIFSLNLLEKKHLLKMGIYEYIHIKPKTRIFVTSFVGFDGYARSYSDHGPKHRNNPSSIKNIQFKKDQI